MSQGRASSQQVQLPNRLANHNPQLSLPMPKTAYFVLLAFTFTPISVFADSPVTLERIMADPDWIGRSAESPIWSYDSSRVFFKRKRKGSEIRRWWTVELDKAPRKLSLADSANEIFARGTKNAQGSKEVYSHESDLFVRDLESGKINQLTRTETNEDRPSFLEHDRIQFRRDNKIYIRDLTTGLESEAAILLTEDEPKQSEKDDGFLTSQENDLFQFLQKQQKEKAARRTQTKKKKRANRNDVDKPYYLGKNRTIQSRHLSPNARWLAIVTGTKDDRKAGRTDRMPVWIRDDAYTESRNVRSLVGTNLEGNDSLSLLDLKRQQVISIDLSVLPQLAVDRLAFLTNQDETSSSKEKPKNRDINIRNVAFSANSKFLLFHCYSTDNKDRWICTVSVKSKAPKVNVIEHRYDPAWINWRAPSSGWIGNTNRLFFVSESSGYFHLSTANPKTGESRQLTDGEFEVSSIHVSSNADKIFFRANKKHPGEYELFSVDVESAELEQLTDLGGLSDFVISPNDRYAVATHSKLDGPPELYHIDLDSKAVKQLTKFTSKKFQNTDWIIPQIVKVPSRHGRPIYSRLYLPEKQTSSKRPAIFFVHGAGYMQNAHKGWSYYFREFMFHTFLVRRGYVVIDMDYRASAGYGRDWRTAIYRQMGTPELEDLEDGFKWIVEHHNVDPELVGIYGGSYGGFMSLMALFKRPGKFACGAALRPVTDWAHYNHGYTSAILNSPNEDAAAYKRSSPIYFAAGLSDPLLICHGMLDDNVFFKDTVRLAQKLIELKKQNWEVAIYPVEPHGFRQPSSWLDEYRRIFKLFETHLQATGSANEVSTARQTNP